MILQFPSSADNFSTCWLFKWILGVPAYEYKLGFSRLYMYDYCGSFVKEKLLRPGSVDTCNFTGLCSGVKRLSVFVFLFCICFLNIVIGYGVRVCGFVEPLLKSHARTKRKGRKKKASSVLDNDSFIKLQETFP